MKSGFWLLINGEDHFDQARDGSKNPAEGAKKAPKISKWHSPDVPPTS